MKFPFLAQAFIFLPAIMLIFFTPMIAGIVLVENSPNTSVYSHTIISWCIIAYPIAVFWFAFYKINQKYKKKRKKRKKK